MRIAIVGGTGSFGRGLAARLRDLGHDVAIGSRDEARARERAAAIGVAGGTNEEIVRDAGLVVLEPSRSREERAEVVPFAHLGDPLDGDHPQLGHGTPVSRRPATAR